MAFLLRRNAHWVQFTRNASVLSAEQPKLKPFSEMPGLSKHIMALSVFYFDLRKNLQNTAMLWKNHGDLVRIEVPFKDPIVMIFDPELCEKVNK